MDGIITLVRKLKEDCIRSSALGPTLAAMPSLLSPHSRSFLEGGKEYWLVAASFPVGICVA